MLYNWELETLLKDNDDKMFKARVTWRQHDKLL